MSAAPHEIGAPRRHLPSCPTRLRGAFARAAAEPADRRTAGLRPGPPSDRPAGRPAGQSAQAPRRQPRRQPPAARQAAARQAAARQTPRQSGCSHGAQAGPMRGLREPTFDELVTGYGRHRGPQQPERADVAASPSRAAGPAAAHAGPASPGPRHLEPVKNGEAQLPPSWEQLLTGTHPSFRPPVSAQRGGRGPARHGRGRWRAGRRVARPVRRPRVVAGERRHGLGRRRPVDRRGRGRRDADRFPRGWSPALTGAALLVPAGCACQAEGVVHPELAGGRCTGPAGAVGLARRLHPQQGIGEIVRRCRRRGLTERASRAGCTRPARPPRGRGRCARRRRRTGSGSRARAETWCAVGHSDRRCVPKFATFSANPRACAMPAARNRAARSAGERHPAWPASRYTQVDPRDSLSDRVRGRACCARPSRPG